MADFTDKRINRTYQRVVQVDDGIIQNGLGVTLSGSMGNLTVNGTLATTGHPNISASLSRLDYFSSSLDDTYARDAELAAVSSSLALETAQLLQFSASLDATYATDAQLETVSSSLALETAQLLQFSASLDATFATDAQLALATVPLTAATASYALKAAISGAFDITSASLASRIAGLDANYATDNQLLALSSSVAATYLPDSEWSFHSASIRNDIFADSIRIAQLEQKTLVSSSNQINITATNGYTDVSASISSLETFSSSLNATFATDVELSSLSSSISATYLSDSEWTFHSESIRNDIFNDSIRIAQLEQKSLVSSSFQLTASLDTAYPRKSEITGSFNAVSGAFVTRIDDLETFSSSLNTVFLSEAEWTFHSASIRNDISYDSSRIAALENKTLVSSSFQLTASLDTAYPRKNQISGSFAIESSRIDALETVVSSSALLNLTPSATLPLNVSTGSLAVTGSTLAFYDGNNWKVVLTGSTLPL